MEENGQDSIRIEKDVKGVRYESRIRRTSNIPIIIALVLEAFILFGVQSDYSTYFSYAFVFFVAVYLTHQYYAIIFSTDPVLGEASDQREFEYRRYKGYDVPANQLKYGYDPVVLVHSESLLISLKRVIRTTHGEVWKKFKKPLKRRMVSLII